MTEPRASRLSAVRFENFQLQPLGKPLLERSELSLVSGRLRFAFHAEKSGFFHVCCVYVHDFDQAIHRPPVYWPLSVNMEIRTGVGCMPSFCERLFFFQPNTTCLHGQFFEKGVGPMRFARNKRKTPG
jgi:hypothetical protein